MSTSLRPPSPEQRVPRSLVRAADVSWRLLVVGAAVVATAMLAARLRVILVPTVVAALAASALWPLTRRLRELGAPNALAALATVTTLVGVIAAVAAALAPGTAEEIGSLDVSVTDGLDVVEGWLTTGPLGLSEPEVQSFFDRAEREVQAASGQIASGAIGGALLAVEAVAGALLAVVLLFFFLKDGDRMWAWVSGLLPEGRRASWDRIATDVRDVLAGFIRGTTIIAFVDAVGIGIGLLLLGVPLVLPLAVLTFLGGFVPLLGATIAGFVAVMVALVSNGFLTALAVLGVVIAVQQLEGNVLQPVVVGRSVQLHPAVVLVAVGAGAVLWGLAGALLAVPVTAALSTMFSGLRDDVSRRGVGGVGRATEARQRL